MAEEMAENEAPVNHEDVSILIDRPPPMPVADHFLDGAQDVQTISLRIKQRVEVKYKLGDIEGLNQRGVASLEQRHVQARPLMTNLYTLQEFVKRVFTSLKEMQAKLLQTTSTTIIDKEAVNKLLCQLEGGGAVPGPRAYISVLGRYNVGKSTLLNALLSFDVLPTSQDAETAVTVFVQHQEMEVPQLCNMSDGVVLETGAENIKTYLKRIQDRVRDKVLSPTAKEYLVRVPIPCFARLRKDYDITPLLLDTPGSNEVSQKELRKLADLNLQTATAYIYVMSFNELRNQQDYTSFENIQKIDQAVFNEGRIVVAVTKMDESYQVAMNDDRITETRVKTIVSQEIQKAFGLDRVSPEIVFPLSGQFALQARVTGRGLGASRMIEAMRIGWGNMMRDSFGYQAMFRAGSMSAEQLYCDLEKSSNIGCLEKRIGLMIDNLDSMWQRSIAVNCWLYINQAEQSLVSKVESIGAQMADCKRLVDQCKEIKRLYDTIIESLSDQSELIAQLEGSFARDTDTGTMMNKKFGVHLNSFMEIVRTKIEAGNYTPKQLEADLNKIRRDANEALSQLCWQTVFDQCQQTMDLFLMKTTERFGRMRNALSKVCNQARPDSLPQQYPAHSIIEDYIRDAAPRLNQIPRQPIQVSKKQWAGYYACMLLFGLPHIKLIKEEALGPIEEDIKRLVRDQHREFFDERKQSIVTHFFRRYCKSMTNLMDILFDQYQYCQYNLTDIANQAHTELTEMQKLQDRCLHWKTELGSWRAKMRVSYGDLLPN